MSAQAIEIAINIRSHAEELHKTISAFRELRTSIGAIRTPLLAVTQSADQFDKKIGELVRHKNVLKGFQDSLKGLAGSISSSGAGTKVGGDNGAGDAASKVSAAFFPKVEALLGHPAAKVGLAAGKLVLEGIATGMQRNAMMEDQVVAFTPLLKSAEAAKDRVAELSAFAATTPFDLPSVAQASRTLEQFGGATLSTGDGLRMVGDAAAATGHPIDEVSRHMGQLYAGLQNGTPVEETTRRMMEMNLISAEQANRLNSLAESGAATGRAYDVLGETFGRFGGTMKAQGETLGGLVHTLKETWLNDLGEMTSGLNDLAKTALRTIAEVQGSVPTAAQQLSDDALAAHRRASSPKSREDLERQKTEADAKVMQIAQSLDSAQTKLSELSVTKHWYLGLVGGSAAYSFEASRLAKEVDDLSQAQLAYKGVQKVLAKKGESNLEQRLHLQKTEEDEAVRKKSEHDSGQWLKENEASQLQRLENLRRQQLSLKDQADLARTDLTKLEAEKARLPGLVDRPNEARAKTLQLDTKILEAKARLLTFDKDINAEEQKAIAARAKVVEVQNPIVKETRETLTKTAEQAEKTRKAAEDALAATQKTNEEASRKKLGESIQAVDGDWTKTKVEKYNYKKSLLLRDSQGYLSDEEYDSSLKKEGPDPESFSQQWQSVLVALQNQWGSFAQQTASAFQSTFNSAVSSVSNGISGLILGTQTWSNALASIGTSVLTSVVNAIVQMGVRWIATQFLMATVGKAIAAASTAATAPIAAAQSAIWAAPATLATISSYGGAAYAAPGLIAGAQGITLAKSQAAFAEGGLTPGTRTLAWVGERGPELVLPADVTSRLSPQQQAMLLEGRLPAVPVPGDGAASATPSARPARQNHYHYWDRARMIADSRDDIAAIVHDVLRSRV